MECDLCFAIQSNSNKFCEYCCADMENRDDSKPSLVSEVIDFIAEKSVPKNINFLNRDSLEKYLITIELITAGYRSFWPFDVSWESMTSGLKRIMELRSKFLTEDSQLAVNLSPDIFLNIRKSLDFEELLLQRYKEVFESQLDARKIGPLAKYFSVLEIDNLKKRLFPIVRIENRIANLDKTILIDKKEYVEWGRMLIECILKELQSLQLLKNIADFNKDFYLNINNHSDKIIHKQFHSERNEVLISDFLEMERETTQIDSDLINKTHVLDKLGVEYIPLFRDDLS